MKLFLREQSAVQAGLANEASSKHAAAGTNGDRSTKAAISGFARCGFSTW